jgi:hypothetical protein
MNIKLLKTATRAWLMEILVAGFNYFILMNRIYEPRWGELTAHRIGMTTRMITICIFAYLLLRRVRNWEQADLVHVGLLWVTLTLIFEWVGSLALGRSVEEILIGWNILNGYMWPYVLFTYFASSFVIGYLGKRINRVT